MPTGVIVSKRFNENSHHSPEINQGHCNDGNIDNHTNNAVQKKAQCVNSVAARKNTYACTHMCGKNGCTHKIAVDTHCHDTTARWAVHRCL